MSYTVEYEDSAGLVRSKIVGDITPQVMKEVTTEAIQLARARSCDMFLFDMRETVVKSSTIEIFDFMTDLASLGFSQRDDRIAIVYATEEETHYFAETVARNRGWRHVSVFSDLEEAEQWLREA
jgi:hypothetical protein